MQILFGWLKPFLKPPLWRAINAALNISIGTEDRPWYLLDGENTHHKRGESGDSENEAPLTPSDMDEDIMSSEEVIKAESRPEMEIGCILVILDQ